MNNKKASELLKSSHRRDFLCSECQNDDGECRSSCEYGKALDCAIKALENSSWIPIKTKKLSPEEIKEFCEETNLFSPDEMDGAWSYDCKLPDDEQDVLVSTKYGVSLTRFYNDVYYGAYFEGYEDEDDVLAWMPLPEPYKKEEQS